MKLMLVASSGGHLTQLLALRPWWSDHERCWMTFRKPDAESALENERVVWAHHPTTRNARNALRNLGLAIVTLARERPDLVVSTGAGVAFPVFLVARLLRVHTMYLEVFDRIDQSTLTGRLCYPLSDAFCVQWDDQRALYPEGHVVGWAI